MKRIVCAVDYSQPSLRAARLAVDLAARCNGELTLLTVVQLPDARQTDLAEFLQRERQTDPPGVVVVEAAREELRALSDRLAQEGAPATACEVRSGNVAAEIVSFAKERAADMIVMGHRGQYRLAQVLLGSVARRVLDTAPCPVLIVR